MIDAKIPHAACLTLQRSDQLRSAEVYWGDSQGLFQLIS